MAIDMAALPGHHGYQNRFLTMQDIVCFEVIAFPFQVQPI